MSLTSILPWKKDGKKLAIQRDSDMVNDTEYPLLSLQTQMNRLFDDFWRNPFSMRPFEAFDRMWPSTLSGSTSGSTMSNFNPSVDISETDKEIKLEAELPGLDENDIEISITQDVLVIQGEKSQEQERKDRNYHFVERSYGKFSRQFPIPASVDEEKIEAMFKKGVLTITMPKRPEAVKQRKRIAVKSG